jgi:inorganic triphosphatase YgiF
MSEDREIELKFLCAREDFDAVLAAAPPGEEKVRDLISVYFDGPDRPLEKAGATLRLRRHGARRIQTFKRGAGLAREEREASVKGDAPDRTMAPLPELIGPKPLEPQFEVRVTRRERRMMHGDAEIELALDEGEIQAGEAVTPLSEVELELKSGEEATLFELARGLAAAAPLYLSFDAKAERGQALRDGRAGKARHRHAPRLPKTATAGEALASTARSTLAQIAANAALVRAAPGAEAVHQLRVATRRLRSTLSTFRKVAPDDLLEAIRNDAKWLAHACDDARNLEVFAGHDLKRLRRLELPRAERAALRAAIRAAQARAQAQAVDAAASPRFRSFMIEAAAWTETGAWREGDAAKGCARDYAAKVLEKRMRRVLKRARKVETGSDDDRHELRIETKKLRYSAEAFESLYPQARVQSFIKPLKALQDALGSLNDQATALEIVEGLALADGDRAAACDAVKAHVGASKSKLVARAAKALEKLREAPRFWA